MYLVSIFLPLFVFLSLSLIGRDIGARGLLVYVNSLNLVNILVALYLFVEVGVRGSVCLVDLGDWISFGILNIKWSFLFDGLTVMMLLIIITISSVVQYFSFFYMWGDPHIIRFLMYLSLFTFFMTFLVTASNFVQLFVGWEGVGLVSFLLISFWHTRDAATKSAFKAIILNRIGDFCFLVGLVLIGGTFFTFDFGILFNSLNGSFTWYEEFFGYYFNLLDLIGLFLILAAVGKSAQLGLHTWLPDAMEGPTPVSALLHAATMVTAGVFLLNRSSYFIENSSFSLTLLLFLGGFTAIFAGTIGMVQNDLKKVIAYSTCSQLGYMVFSLGLSAYSLSMYHLFNHAFFKALLFLGAGCVIHALQDQQDMRLMGGLAYYLPISYGFITVGSLSLMSLPFLTGFYSKDYILEVFAFSYLIKGDFFFWVGILAAFCTTFYSLRLLFLVFYGKPRFSKSIFTNIHEISYDLAGGLIFLAAGSIFFGYIFRDIFVGLGTNYWGNSLINLDFDKVSYLIDAEFAPVFYKQIPLIGAFLGILLSYLIYHLRLFIVSHSFFRKVYLFLSQRWFFDQIYNYFIVFSSFLFGLNWGLKVIDKGVLETYGASGFVALVNTISSDLSRISFTGSLYIYAFAMLFFVSSVIILSFIATANFILFVTTFVVVFFITEIS